jgi:proteasome lid subunit RPN8/RPN11
MACLEEIEDMSPVTEISVNGVERTLLCLHDAGRRSKESVVLWLGRLETDKVAITEVYMPAQEAASDFFRIPREGISALIRYLRERGLMVAAQVHTHPSVAFHSAADDRWAIVRHAGALSLVLPYFGLRTTASTFTKDAVVFRLSEDNRWVRVPFAGVEGCYGVRP